MELYQGTSLDFLIISLFLIMMFAIWNGLVNKQMYQDKTLERKRATSKVWYKVGVLIRLGLGLIAFISYGYIGALLATILAYPVYDNLIDLVRGSKLSYYGESKFDQFAKKYKLDLVVLILCSVGIVLLYLQ